MSDQANNIVVGVDGGGTGCRVAIATTQGARLGPRLGTAKGGPANPTYKPREALKNLLGAIEAARVDAGLDTKTLSNARAFVGLAGIRSPEIAEFVASALPFKHSRVVEDRITTVTGALAGGDGAVAAIGTGSFIARLNDDHAEYVGGWGFRLGDQASGAWLGKQLLRHVILCLDEVELHSPLTRNILADYDNDGHKIYAFSNTAEPAEFAELAPKITAAKDDRTATALMQAGADYILKALQSLGYQPGEPLCLTGGLGPHYANYLPNAFADQLVAPKGSALQGALLLAAKMELTP